MSGPFVSVARLPESARLQVLASMSGRKSRITLWPSPEASGPAMLAPLLLTPDLQRDAFQADHGLALRGNRAKAGRIAHEAKKATTAILRGICSGEVKQ